MHYPPRMFPWICLDAGATLKMDAQMPQGWPDARHDEVAGTFHMWRESVRELMKAEGLAWYVVIDPAASPNLPGLLWTLEGAPRVWPLCTRASGPGLTMSGPLLVAAEPDGDLIGWFVDGSRDHALGVLYAVPAGGCRALLEHLRGLLDCERQPGGMGLSRFHDPRVLHALFRSGDRCRLGMVLGPGNMLLAWEPRRSEPVRLDAEPRPVTP